MNKINYFSHRMLAGAAAVMIALASHAFASDVPQLVTVIKVEGVARFSVDNGKTWQPVHRGDQLQPGSVIETAEKSTVDILMGEKQGPILATPTGPTSTISTGSSGMDSGPKSNVIRIFPSSVLAVDKLVLDRTGVDEVSETQLDLRAGQIMGNVKKLSAASRYEVKIPNGVAGIRGTTFMVSATGVVYVLTGQVIISYIGPGGAVVTQTVAAGQSFNPFNANGTPGPGTVTPIPTPVLTALIGTSKGISTPQDYTGGANGAGGNPTLVHISPD